MPSDFVASVQLRDAISTVRRTDTEANRRVLRREILASQFLVPAKVGQGQDPNRDGYRILFVTDPTDGKPVLVAFSDEEAVLRWTEQTPAGCVIMSGVVLVETALDYRFSALVLNPDAGGAVVLNAEVLRGLINHSP
jgi:hypothetical protein